jgi:hypothetical protein
MARGHEDWLIAGPAPGITKVTIILKPNAQGYQQRCTVAQSHGVQRQDRTRWHDLPVAEQGGDAIGDPQTAMRCERIPQRLERRVQRPGPA